MIRRKLSARSVMAITKPGRHSDGAGLYLLVKDGRKSWVYMFNWQGRQCEMGLGAWPETSLAQARDLRDRWRQELRDGRNPIEMRRSGNALVHGKTFGDCVREFLAAKSSQWGNARHREQWHKTLETYAAPLGHLPVDKVTTEVVLEILQPLWRVIPETASRLRGRIEAVLDYARVRGWRQGPNPATWRGHLALTLPKRDKHSRGHYPAMNIGEIPLFISKLRERPGIAMRALEFLTLTAGRSNEVLGARWSEIDLEAKVWVVPPVRMKNHRQHTVPLSTRAMELLEELKAIRAGDFIFPGARPNSHLGHSSLGDAMKRLQVKGASPHGLRSSFRDWVGDETNFDPRLAELSLAHVEGNATEQSYRRNTAVARRRVVMQAWADFCNRVDSVVYQFPMRG